MLIVTPVVPLQWTTPVGWNLFAMLAIGAFGGIGHFILIIAYRLAPAPVKGLSRRRVWFLHAFKNTLLPVITVFGVQLGILLAFTILTEQVFQWQGMGFMFLEAVERSDTSLLVAYLVVVGVIFVAVNMVVDIVYGLVNPMVRIAGTK